ncbi:hypothetical protein JCM21900_002607 [Sporobolomyces salmonicolor]
MLARTHRLDHNQENPHTLPYQSHHPTKTPARQPLAGPSGKAAAPVTGGKGLLHTTGRTGRVLGAKDRNQAKSGAPESALLFPGGKPSTSAVQAGPSCAPVLSTSQRQQFKTPAPSKTFRPLADLQTPATALRPRHAPMLVASPDVSMEMDAEEEQLEPEEEEDREVEYAGPSGRDYDEPYVPDCPELDYKRAGYGAMLREVSFLGTETHEEWEERDAEERKEMKVEMDELVFLETALDPLVDPSQPMFPLPPSKRRVPLLTKPPNPPSSSAARMRTVSALGSSVSGKSADASARKPSTAVPSFRRPNLNPSASAPVTATRRTLGAIDSSLRTSVRPGVPSTALSSTKPSLAASLSSSTARKPLGRAATRPSSSLSTTSTNGSRPATLALKSTASSSSLRGVGGKSSSTSISSTATASSHAAARKKMAEAEAEEERALGAFGIVDEVEGSALFADENNSLGAGLLEEGFRFDLED